MSESATFVDLQVNGYAGVDFNADGLTAEDLHAVCLRLRDEGVAGILPTIITDSLETMTARLARLVELRAADPLAEELIWGLHIEGPFISRLTGYVGAHPVDQVRPAEVDAMKRLLEAAGSLTRIVTLAPECDPGLRTTRFLADLGICVSAGHSDASLDELHAAIDAGLSMFTHLGNGCPGQMRRHDNIVQRVLSLADKLWISFIADGAHVPCFALKNYLQVTGLDRAVIVTDAISAAGLGPGRYTLGPQTIEIGEDLVPWSEDRSHFVGSAATMPTMAERLERELSMTAREVEQLMSTNPRLVLGETD